MDKIDSTVSGIVERHRADVLGLAFVFVVANGKAFTI